MNQIKYRFDGVTEKNQILFRKAIALAERVVFDPMFLMILKDEIEKSNGMEGELSHWKDALPAQIYAQLFPIDLNIQTYYTSRDVIGYGTAADRVIHVNTKYLNGYSADSLLDMMEVFSNLLHEDSHDKGFGHDFNNTKRRKNSVSYILNRVYERTFKYIYDMPLWVETPYVAPWYVRVLGWFR